MSKFSISLFLQAYDDARASNAPSRSPIRWNRDLNGVSVLNPSTVDYTIDPGTTQILFSSIRTLLQDLTTEYSLALLPLSTTTYVLSWVGGTAPNFRTPRVLATDATTQITTSVNGPVETFTITSTFATYASFTGLIAGMTTSVTITANTIGTVGNSVVLDADGTSSISTLITAWNTANPSNTITLTSGDGTQIPSAGTYAMYSGTPTGATTPVMLQAVTIGSPGNSIALVGDGTSTIATLISNWNIANPSNQVSFTSGLESQTPAIGATIDLSGGEFPDTITLTGGTAAQPLNLVTSGVVVGDYVTIGTQFNISNQGTFQIIAVTPSSFSVINPTPIVEGPITLGSSYATQLQIYGATGVQVGDTLVISSGFSPVSWGSYVITAVFAESLQFSSTAVLPQEGPITTEVTIYSDAKQFIYIEANNPIGVSLNGSANITIQPFLLTSCGCAKNEPGMLMLKSTIYSISVTNSGINTVNITLAACE
jgi:hypothetical protein